MDGLANGAGATLMGEGGPSAGLASGGERGDDLSSGSKDVSSFGAGVGGEKGVRMLRAGGSTSPSPLPLLPLPPLPPLPPLSPLSPLPLPLPPLPPLGRLKETRFLGTGGGASYSSKVLLKETL